MKKCILYMCILIACFVAFPAAVFAAETGSASLSIQKNNVDVSLGLPDGKAGKITSLRMQLRVTAVSGTMEQPSFKFKDTVKSYIKDASVSKEKSGSYIVDIIISGKNGGDMFANADGGSIGTLSVNPSGKSYRIKVEIMSQDKDSNTPGIKYVEKGGLKEKVLLLSDTNPVSISSSGDVVKPSEKPDTPTPAKTPRPKPPITSSKPKPPAVTSKPIASPRPSASHPPFKSGSSILSVSCKSGSKRVYFNWQKNEKADGYALYEYDKKTGKDTLIKLITDVNKTSYSQNFKYASKHSFRLCPFKVYSDGSILYGDLTSIVNIKVPPAGVKGFSASKAKAKVTLSWKKLSGAKGYKIYKSSRKNGKYTMIKRIKKNSKVKYTDKRVTGGQTYYYKIRAYVNGEQKKMADGKFSKVLKVRVPR